MGVNEFEIRATFEPVIPVNVPKAVVVAGKPVMGSGVPVGFAATTTSFVVINVSSGASGVIERTL